MSLSFIKDKFVFQKLAKTLTNVANGARISEGVAKEIGGMLINLFSLPNFSIEKVSLIDTHVKEVIRRVGG